MNDANDEAVAEVSGCGGISGARDTSGDLSGADGSNRKVSNLAQMMKAAKYDHIVVNDSDIRVERDYLRRIVAPMEDAHTGMVTCLYRAEAGRTVWRRGWRR